MSLPGAPVPPVTLLRRPRFWGVAWLGWFAALTILSSMSQPGPKIEVIGFDKLVHAVFFALGGTCLALALVLRQPAAAPVPPRWGRIAVIVILAGAVVGWLDEWHQSFTPGRTGLDEYDWLADVLGSVLALPMARGVFRRFLGTERT